MSKERVFENIIKTQNTFRQSNILCDVTLIADDGVTFPAHKVILSSVSPFFLSMFHNDFKEKNEHEVKIKEIDSCILEIIIKYIYTLELDMTEDNKDNIVDILRAIYFFQLDDLFKEECSDFIENNINLTNCVSLMQFSKLVSFDKLYDLSFPYILENLFDLEDSILHNLSYEEVKLFISDNGLVTESEDQVLLFILNWIKFDEENRKLFLPELLQNVRWTFISDITLTNALCEPLLKDNTNMRYINTNLCDPKYCQKRKRILKSIINKSNVRDFFSASFYYNIFNDIYNWTSGLCFFQSPPNINSIIIGFKNRFLYSIGGRKNGIVTNEVYILDPLTTYKNWVQIESMLSARDYHSVCIHKKRIFSVGGVDAEGHVLNTIEVLNINTKKWSMYCTMLNPRKKCSTIYHNNLLYIIGGINENAECLSSLECYDDLSSTWLNYIDPLPNPLCQASIIIYDNEIYVIGGNNINTSFSTVFRYTLHDMFNNWCTLPVLKNPRHLAMVWVLNEKFYIFGGSSCTGGSVTTLEVFDPKKCL